MSSEPRLFTPPFFLMCSYTFTVFLSAFQLLPTAPYRIVQMGGTTFMAGLFLGFLTYASAFSAPIMGALGDQIGRRRMLVRCSLAIAALSVLYAFAKDPKWMLAIVLFHGVFWSGLLSASAAYMTAIIPPARRGEGIGYWGMATVLATSAAPALGVCPGNPGVAFRAPRGRLPGDATTGDTGHHRGASTPQTAPRRPEPLGRMGVAVKLGVAATLRRANSSTRRCALILPRKPHTCGPGITGTDS